MRSQLSSLANARRWMGYVMGVGDWGHLLIVGATKSNQQGGGKEGKNTDTHPERESDSTWQLHLQQFSLALPCCGNRWS